MSESAYNSPMVGRRLTESCCSSPARSFGRKTPEVLSDSDDGDGDVCSVVEDITIPEQTVIAGWLKFRDNKKWKQRWGVVTKLSPAADCLHLQLYRDSKDRYKQGQTKASLSLEHFLGLETGFTLDKESNTVAILCQDVVVVLAFDSRERLMQWQVKLSNHLGDGPHFLVLLSSAPSKARLPAGPARMHVQEYGFCLTTGVPPRVAGHWLISNLRRYGVVEGRFCFEGGSRCGRGEGLHVLLTDQGDEISATLKMAAQGQISTLRKRPLSRNMTVIESPSRRSTLRTELRKPLELSESRSDSPYTDLESSYGCGEGPLEPSWANTMPSAMERCMSCISKLGALSRSSTATTVPGTVPCWEHSCDRHSLSSGSDCSGWTVAQPPPARPPKPPTLTPKKVVPATKTGNYDNYDVPKTPLLVEPKADEHYDTPRKIKECLADALRKPCGCVLRIRQPEPDRPCVCQRLLSCWTAADDVQALYATVDVTKKNRHNNNSNNYANINPLPPPPHPPLPNYANMEFVQSLELYENAKHVAQMAHAVICDKCGHSQEDYTLMGPMVAKGANHCASSQQHAGYIPMSPAVKQRLDKVLSLSNPNLAPHVDRTAKPSGSSMLQANIYHRKQLLDSTDNLERRKRSNSADSTNDALVACVAANAQCACAQVVRRSSSVPCKSNRDSSSSNDSGVFDMSRRFPCTLATLPRRSKSSDPLRDIAFQFQKGAAEGKSASAEAEVPVCPSESTSSATSDMSDYIETLSLSSHSSTEVAAPPPSCTLRPRSGNEYLTVQRLIAPVPEERHN